MLNHRRQLTGDAHFVQLSELLVEGLPGDVVTQADGAEGDEAKVKGFQEVPVLLQGREDGGGDEEEEGDGQHGQDGGVCDGHQRLGQTPARVDVLDGLPRAEDHDPLHHGGEEEEGEGDANHRVDYAEGLAPVRQWRRVAISCMRTNGK